MIFGVKCLPSVQRSNLTKTFFVVLCFPAVKYAEWTFPHSHADTYLLMCSSLFCSFICQDSANLPEGASTPALGLSNKAVFQGKILAQLCI